MCDVAERLEQMGIAKGIEIGRSEGKTEGKIEGKILVYRNLCREGFNEKEARRLTELPEDKCQIKAVQQMLMTVLLPPPLRMYRKN